MLNKNLTLVALVIFAAGCGTELRTYVITKPRVGLDQTSGNGGCVVGKCPPAPAPTETTRKVYVLEITKPVPESEVQKIEQNAVAAIAESQTTPAPETTPAETTPAASDNAQPAASSGVSVPVIGELPGTVASGSVSTSTPAAPEQNGGNLQATTYTVQKDDTLQKISRKVYGTYGKWYKIYKANKDKIKNPNVLQPGLVLTIPSLK